MAEESMYLGEVSFSERMDLLSHEETTAKNLEVTVHNSLRVSFKIMS